MRVCGGLTCRIAGSERVAQELRAEGREVEAHECMFLCAAAPLTAAGSASIETTVGNELFAAARRDRAGRTHAGDGATRRDLARLGGGGGDAAE